MDNSHNAVDKSFLELEKFCSETMGQSESKKASKKSSGPETKGTSMSFGFKKKKIHSMSPKKLNIANNFALKSDSAVIYSNHSIIKAKDNEITNTDNEKDNKTETRQASGCNELSSQNNQRVDGSNRFGFTARRQQVLRNESRQSHNDGSNSRINSAPIVSDNDSRSRKSSTSTVRSNVLPRPQFAIQVNVTAPVYERRATSLTVVNESRLNHIQNRLLDTKTQKHVANVAARRGVLMGRREESFDSGIASHENVSSHHLDQPRQKSRHFEIVPSGRHKFEIRDLKDFSDTATVVPLMLPKLPTNRQEIVTCGLIKSRSCESSTRSTFLSSRDSFHGETLKEAPKLEKNSILNPITKDEANIGKTSSIASNLIAATYYCKDTVDKSVINHKDEDCDKDEMSSKASTSNNCNRSDSSPKPSVNAEKNVCNDAFMRQHPKMGSITRKEMLMEIDELKFAATVKICSENSTLLEEETSPTDSLVSSDSGEATMRKSANCRSTFEDIEEIDLEDTSNPELVDLISPESPGTPTHVSNSMSLSDDGNKDEFLIDDEICDQPQLIFNEKHKSSGSTNIYSPDTLISQNYAANSKESLTSLNRVKPQQFHSPSRKIIERAGSYNTLSLQDSISSDDLMGDFDGSLDSIDRPGLSNDDLIFNSETDLRNTAKQKFGSETKFLRKNNTHGSITLPMHATRLLNRRSQCTNNAALNQNYNGAESPRLLYSMHNRNTTSRALMNESFKQRHQLLKQPNLLNSSSEDLAYKNDVLQDVVAFKKNLLQLRRVLQEDDDNLKRSDTLNPFDTNGQFADLLDDKFYESTKNNNNSDRDDENNVILSNAQIALFEEQRQELADLKRQVVFLQGQIVDKDRTIKVQQNEMEQLRSKAPKHAPTGVLTGKATCATQTDRVPRSYSTCQEKLTSFTQRSKGSHASASFTENRYPQIKIESAMPKSKTQISSVFTKFSSIKPSRLGIPNQNSTISSVPNAKPVKTTVIGNSKAEVYKELQPAMLWEASKRLPVKMTKRNHDQPKSVDTLSFQQKVPPT